MISLKGSSVVRFYVFFFKLKTLPVGVLKIVEGLLTGTLEKTAGVAFGKRRLMAPLTVGVAFAVGLVILITEKLSNALSH